MRFPIIIAAIFGIPLGTRILLGLFTTGFHEYEAAFLYASDFIVIALVASVLFINRKDGVSISRILIVLLAIVVGSSLLSLMSAPISALAMYRFLRLIFLILFAYAVGTVLRGKQHLTIAATVLVVLGVVESVIAFLQFKIQHALGLSFFGESPISVTDPASSRIIVDGLHVLRGYGTFPHPNILGAFLVLSFAALIYLWFSVSIPKLNVTRRNWKDAFRRYRPVFLTTIILSIAFFVLSLGLVLTFSRSAWVTSAILLIVPFAALFYSVLRKQAMKFFVVLGVTAWILFSIFSFWIIPRVGVSPVERSVSERVSYMQIAREMIKVNPMGVGLGNQIFSGVRSGLYGDYGVRESWKWQPVHNIYLLAAVEIGVLGGISLLLFLVALTFAVMYRAVTLQNIWVSVLLISFIVFGFFDHFLWDLWQGQLMLWLVIGIAFAHLRSRS
ncbi:MAG: O-antigen ligase family protein [Patescibacteria group bacterium]